MNIKLLSILPNCYKCIYFMEHPNKFEDLAICLKFKKGYINDKPKYEFAEICRKDESKCGINGKEHKHIDF